ncbi:hypothetical protein MKZ38_003540 [Zalerion maritima]|uniref:Nucleoside phosphorylase domain-containing protein n=1 Tax=Zalerion maritima TaxID=339359 RepID=A0AAD5RMM1_9PEZI|nr:hypothetical protein MKZ38_003540 [Zalerion maritima]
MGKVNAASAAASLRASYPELRLVLVTGICGGVPNPGTKKEIPLGDVVVSKTVVQYDLGRLYADDFAMRDAVEDRLGRPTKNVRNLLAVFETELGRQRLEQRAATTLRETYNSAPRKRRRADYCYPRVV